MGGPADGGNFLFCGGTMWKVEISIKPIYADIFSIFPEGTHETGGQKLKLLPWFGVLAGRQRRMLGLQERYCIDTVFIDFFVRKACSSMGV